MARDMDELITFPGFNDDDAGAAPAVRGRSMRSRTPRWRSRGLIVTIAIVLLLIDAICDLRSEIS